MSKPSARVHPLRNLCTPSQLLQGIAIALLICTSTTGQCAYEVVATFGISSCGPGLQPILQASAINNRGEVVGTYSQCAIGYDRPFYWSEATGLVLPPLPPGYFSAQFNDINDKGQITGNRVVTNSGLGNEAILYEGGRWTGLGTMPGGNGSDGLAINNDGTIVGFWLNSITGPVQAFRWDGGTMIDLGPTLGGIVSKALGVSDSGVIVGYVTPLVPYSETGFVFDGNSVTFIPPFPGMLNSKVGVISQSGSAIIVYGNIDSEIPYKQSFLVSGDSWQFLPPNPPGVSVVATGIDATGTVVGFNYGNGIQQGIIFSNGTMQVLEDMIISQERYAISGGAMNALGWIVAGTAIGQIPVTIVLRPVPPPLGDLNNDCNVNAADLAILLGSWGGAGGAADLDADGNVDAQDLSTLLGNWDGS